MTTSGGKYKCVIMGDSGGKTEVFYSFAVEKSSISAGKFCRNLMSTYYLVMTKCLYMTSIQWVHSFYDECWLSKMKEHFLKLWPSFFVWYGILSIIIHSIIYITLLLLIMELIVIKIFFIWSICYILFNTNNNKAIWIYFRINNM